MRTTVVTKTEGVCARSITMEVENGKVYNVRFVGGCPGQGKAVAALVEGMDARKVVDLLKNIECGSKGTSCSAQMARCLEEYITTFKD